MTDVADKSLSDSELKTPPNAFSRFKRKRTDEYSSELGSFKEEIKSMLFKQEQDFRKILNDIKQSNDCIQSSVTLLTVQNEEFRKKIDKLENKIQEDQKYIILLEDRIEDIQIGNRKANFELKNVPKKASETKEDLIEMVLNLSNNVGGNINKPDIRDIYRVRGKKEGPQNTPIIVETSSTLLKTDILKMSKNFNVKHKTKLRALHLGFRTSEDTPIYVSEQLTARGSRLHFLARDLAKSKQYKFCWTAYGKVYVRKAENTPIIAIKTEAQVQQLLLEQ
ncbi:Zinc finger DNA binding protein [Operophtera brumata]|uniref:Zinc finger DNA binding protein n=3 Tax=Operophtera brumata TaxID=104452 RepID=A0A0L7KVZ1_OPEBR|nr:Zinc finger DNA binding protein [Operophtera brumata]KOB67295.1 Zinc finger DNA binding protein [Operophtera brumata]